MAKFNYRMQSVLDIKSQLEEQARMEFALARNRLDEEEAKLATLKERREHYETQGRSLRSDRLHIQDIMDNRTAIERMKEYMLSQQARVTKAQNLLEQARAAMQTAMQERKTQEKLRERAFEDFVQEINTAEAKEVDELTSYTYGQRRGEEENAE